MRTNVQTSPYGSIGVDNLNLHYMIGSPPENAALREALTRIVVFAAKNPDPGSEFDLATRDIRDLSTAAFLSELAKRGYECIVAESDGKFAGLVGYQAHSDGSWHSFAYHVPPELQGLGIGKQLVRAFLEAGFNAGVMNMRIFAGNIRRELSDKDDKTMRHLFEDVVVGNKLDLPFFVERGESIGWVRIMRGQSLHA